MGESDALSKLTQAVDEAVYTALQSSTLSHRQVADLLRRLADGWEDAA